MDAVNQIKRDMKRSFNQYTNTELLALDNDTVNDAIKLEAIERGVTPPIPFSEVLLKAEFHGYTKPLEAVPVFELCIQGKYSGISNSGLGYLSESQAVTALEGLVQIEEVTYGADQGTKLHQGVASVMKKYVGVSKAEQAWAKVVTYQEGLEPFNKIMEECITRLTGVRQADYTRRVNSEKRVEYLRLAGGDETIAKGFWAKVEKTEWPLE